VGRAEWRKGSSGWGQMQERKGCVFERLGSVEDGGMEEECERLGSEEWKRSVSGWGQRNGRGVRAAGVRGMEEECEQVGSEEWKRSASGWGQRPTSVGQQNPLILALCPATELQARGK
jgi:hypothetical protein